MGWAEITHPFHPLRGQRFPILKTRRWAGQPTLILAGNEGGTFGVPAEWTDQAAPSGGHDVLSVPALQALAQCLQQIEAKTSAAAKGG